MIRPHQVERLLAVLKSHPLGVIATVSAENLPEAALMQFAETDKLEIIFGTHPSRKLQNIENSGRVAWVIGWDHVTLQYEGHVTKLVGPELDTHLALYLKKLPEAAAHMHPTTTYYKVTPTWIRYTDVAVNPPEVFEVAP
ncbi:MAG: pyridoxamine 5'-phosphate oxidase family protein [Candidatus Kerfeldbacteria bacterium]|nr:pyridoxamine 5'-phosphate oxidase family protein [Candidatus Kerfeldbacteria bacterium]